MNGVMDYNWLEENGLGRAMGIIIQKKSEITQLLLSARFEFQKRAGISDTMTITRETKNNKGEKYV